MRQTLEKRVLSIMEDEFGKEVCSTSKFSVVAYELIRDLEGWSVNSLWTGASNVDIKGVLQYARGRWEVYKLNYAPKARVCDLSADDIFDEETVQISHNHIPVFGISLEKF